MKTTIKMLKTETGADNGYTVKEYAEGQTYEVSEDLAACFLSTKSAVVVAPAGEADSTTEPEPAPAKPGKKK